MVIDKDKKITLESLCGVLSTILAELIALIIAAIVQKKKKQR